MIVAGFTTLSDSDTKSKPDGISVRYSQFIRKHKIKQAGITRAEWNT